jgi:hypothetical protein
MCQGDCGRTTAAESSSVMRNKLLMILVICLLSFAWLAIECALWLLSLMARGALSVGKHNIFLFQAEMRLTDAKKPLDGAFRQIHSFMRTR